MAKHCSPYRGWSILWIRLKVEWYSNRHKNLTDNVRLVEEKASAKQDHCWKADEKLAQANSKITELEAKLTELQRELAVLQKQDKKTPIIWDDPYEFSGSDLEPTSGQLSWKQKKGQAFPPSISYRGFFLVWGLLKVFLPKACMQQSLCRWSLAQSFKATAIGSVTRGKLDKYEKECDIWMWLSRVTAWW